MTDVEEATDHLEEFIETLLRSPARKNLSKWMNQFFRGLADEVNGFGRNQITLSELVDIERSCLGRMDYSASLAKVLVEFMGEGEEDV